MNRTPSIVLLAALALAGAAAGCARTPSTTAVQVTDRGFEPAVLHLPRGAAGAPVTFTITRRTDATCATEVVFPSLHERRALPLGKPVQFTLPSGTSGTVAYQCAMGMISGSVVVE